MFGTLSALPPSHSLPQFLTSRRERLSDLPSAYTNGEQNRSIDRSIGRSVDQSPTALIAARALQMAESDEAPARARADGCLLRSDGRGRERRRQEEHFEDGRGILLIYVLVCTRCTYTGWAWGRLHRWSRSRNPTLGKLEERHPDVRSRIATLHWPNRENGLA